MTLPPDTAALVDQDQARLRHMGPLPGGGFGMELEGGPVEAIAEYLSNMLGMQGDAPSNYVQIDVHRADLGWMTLTLQRQSGKTPHQLRVEAETKLSEAAATIEAQARRIEEGQWQDMDTAPTDGTPLMLFARCVTATAPVILIGWYVEGQWIESSYSQPVGIVPYAWRAMPAFPDLARANGARDEGEGADA